jgi:hypothetical protein
VAVLPGHLEIENNIEFHIYTSCGRERSDTVSTALFDIYDPKKSSNISHTGVNNFPELVYNIVL